MRKVYPHLKLYFSILILVFSSCNKLDYNANTQRENEILSKFFNLSETSSFEIKKVAAVLKEKNIIAGFIKDMGIKDGYPKWNKSIIENRKNAYGNAAVSNNTGNDTLIYIPLVLEKGNKVNAFLYVTLNGTTNISLYRANDFEAYGFGDISDSTMNAEKLAVQFMLLDYNTFSHQDFDILDNRLLKDKSIPVHALTRNRKVHIEHNLETQGRGFEVWEYTICNTTQYLDFNTPGQCCSNGSCEGCQNQCWRSSTVCTKTSILVYFEDDNDPPPGGSGGGGGGSSGGGGPTGQVPCNPTPEINNGLLPCPRGNTSGWMPVLIPEPFNTDTTFLKSIAENISIQSDSVFNWAFQTGNNLREQGGIIVNNNGQIYLKNLQPGREGRTRAINYSLAPEEILLGYFHTHPVDADYKLRSFFSDDDFLEFHKNARTNQGFLMFLECGNKRFIVVVEDLQKYQAFMNLARIKQLDRERYIENVLLPQQPNLYSNGQQASINAAIQFFGSINNCGLGFYEANGPAKTNFVNLNP